MIVRGTFAKYIRPGSVFIETGTREGDSCAIALELGAKEIWSTEHKQDRHEGAKKRFAGKPNVHLQFGNSPDCLGTIMGHVKGPAVFWIDAHSGTESPILQELDIIRNHPIKTHTILVDDVRLLKNGSWKISLGTVVDRLILINPQYVLSFEDGYVPGDILVARI